VNTEPSQSATLLDVDALVEENERLRKEARRLREQVTAFESSRWWRLHPRRLVGTAPVAEPENGMTTASTSFPLDFDDADRELCLRVKPYTMTTPPRIYALARSVEYVVRQEIAGAVVECGVWRGGSMMAVALTLLRLGVTDRDLYLFDTFEGMTEPGAEDVMHTGERAAELLADPRRQEHYRAAAGLDEVRRSMLEVGYPQDRLHFVQGPVEETLPDRAPDEVALLRLDTDWYASTKHELVHLYPRLAPGGVLIVDDYAYWHGARRAVDEYVEEHELPLLLNRVDYTARLAVKP
jgi:O-methyltransferase